MHFSKMNGGMITGDTCNGQQKPSNILFEAIENAGQEKAVAGTENCPTVLMKDCHQHTHKCFYWFSH